jgi:hypothetical protein
MIQMSLSGTVNDSNVIIWYGTMHGHYLCVKGIDFAYFFDFFLLESGAVVVDWYLFILLDFCLSN